MAEQIVEVAIKCGKNIYRMKDSKRHSDVLKKIILEELEDDTSDAVYGFITSEDHFVDRFEAAEIVLNNGQVNELKNPSKLYSEDLW